MSDVAIIGAGITGLALADALEGAAGEEGTARVIVLERNDRVGGNIRTERIDDYVCERGPNGFLDNAPATLALVRRLGLEDRLQVSSEAARRRFIFARGRLHEVPVSPIPFLRSGLLSWRGKLRVACEPFAAGPPETEETVYDFAARRVGREAADMLVDPMVSGIFGGDAQRLSLRACFPKMAQMEREHGSLVRAALARRRTRPSARAALGAPTGRLTSFASGTEELSRALAARLGRGVETNARVTAVERLASHQTREGRPRYRLHVARRPPLDVDAVVLAGPASESAAIVEELDDGLAQALREIVTAPLAVVCLGYDEPRLVGNRGPLNGFGFLVPRREGVRLLGALWESSIYPGRAPSGRVLIRVMIGGALDPGALELNDPELLSLARSELYTTMGLNCPPVFAHVFRHRVGIPQYTVGHLHRLDTIERRLQAHPGLFVAGNSYRGISLNACVEDAAPTARRILGWLRTAAPAGKPAAVGLTPASFTPAAGGNGLARWHP